MKNLKDIILEKLVINKNTNFRKLNYHPKDKDELKELVKQLIGERGEDADLNDIDTSEITDMSYLFCKTYDIYNKCWKFNGNISKWDVSNVRNMSYMFNDSIFNGDISNWDVSHVTNMGYMFDGSQFNGDISKWDVSNVEYMNCMFEDSKFNKDISRWDVSNVEKMYYMFMGSKFSGNISNWNVSKARNKMLNMFKNCPLEKNPPKWYKE